MKVFLKILLWVVLVALVLLVIILLAAQIPNEFRDVGKGGIYDLFNYIIEQFNKGRAVQGSLAVPFAPLFGSIRV